MAQKEVIIVTDGDRVAKGAVEEAAKNIGGRCISMSAGNPTILSGREIIELVKIAEHNPVVIMVDDRGEKGKGKGEEALEEILQSDDIKILGLVAVASNGKDKFGLKIDFSIDKEGQKIKHAVDKCGNQLDIKEISGDTISIIKKYKNKIPVVVGIGDPGKMDYKDKSYIGAPVTTRALKEIMENSKDISIKMVQPVSIEETGWD